MTGKTRRSGDARGGFCAGVLNVICIDRPCGELELNKKKLIGCSAVRPTLMTAAGITLDHGLGLCQSIEELSVLHFHALHPKSGNLFPPSR